MELLVLRQMFALALQVGPVRHVKHLYVILLASMATARLPMYAPVNQVGLDPFVIWLTAPIHAKMEAPATHQTCALVHQVGKGQRVNWFQVAIHHVL